MKEKNKMLLIIILILIFILSILVNASEFVLSCILLVTGCFIALVK